MCAQMVLKSSFLLLAAVGNLASIDLNSSFHAGASDLLGEGHFSLHVKDRERHGQMTVLPVCLNTLFVRRFFSSLLHMLYNIVPPLIFFGSFGGILVILSRVVLRMRRFQVATAIQAEASSEASVPANLLTPTSPGLQVMKSRLQVVSASMKQTAAATVATSQRSINALKNMQKQIVMPTNRWKEKITSVLPALVSKTKNITVAIVAKLRSRRAIARDASSRPQELTPEPATPPIRVSRSEKVEEEIPTLPIPDEIAPASKAALTTSKNFMTQLLQREQPLSVYDQAQRALEIADYQQVEDILVPFILEHTHDIKAYMVLGRAFSGKGNYADAMEIFQQVIKLNSQEPGAQAALGLAAFKEGKFTIAVQALQRARDAGSVDHEVLVSLLSIAEHMDNKVLQRSLLEELLTVQPDNQEYIQALTALEERQVTVEQH